MQRSSLVVLFVSFSIADPKRIQPYADSNENRIAEEASYISSPQNQESKEKEEIKKYGENEKNQKNEKKQPPSKNDVVIVHNSKAKHHGFSLGVQEVMEASAEFAKKGGWKRGKQLLRKFEILNKIYESYKEFNLHDQDFVRTMQQWDKKQKLETLQNIRLGISKLKLFAIIPIGKRLVEYFPGLFDGAVWQQAHDPKETLRRVASEKLKGNVEFNVFIEEGTKELEEKSEKDGCTNTDEVITKVLTVMNCLTDGEAEIMGNKIDQMKTNDENNIPDNDMETQLEENIPLSLAELKADIQNPKGGKQSWFQKHIKGKFWFNATLWILMFIGGLVVFGLGAAFGSFALAGLSIPLFVIAAFVLFGAIRV